MVFFGADFFGEHSIEIDFMEQTLVLNAPNPEWSPQFQLPLQGWRVPLSYDDRPEQLWFIDTGSKLCFRWTKFTAAHKAQTIDFLLHGPARFDLVADGRFFLMNGLWGEPRSLNHMYKVRTWPGIVGQNLLSHLHCYFDRQSGLLRLKPNHQPRESWMDYSVEQYTPGFQIVSRLDIDPSGALPR